MILPLLHLRYFKWFYKYLIAIFLYLTCFYTGSFAEINNPFEMPFPNCSASHIDGSFAPLVNPVFSDTSKAYYLTYRHFKYTNQRDGNHFYMMNFGGFSFSYIWFDNLFNESNHQVESSKTKFFYIDKGFFYNNILGIGISYSFSKSRFNKYDGYRSCSIGLLYRPINFISLGFVLKDLNNPKLDDNGIRHREVYSISFRPYRDYITLSVDAIRKAGVKFTKCDLLYSANLHMKYDVSFFLSSNKNKDISFGLSIPLGFQSAGNSTMIFDFYSSQRRDDASDSYNFGATFTNEKLNSFNVLPKRFLYINIKDFIEEVTAKHLFKKKQPSFYNLLNAIREARVDGNIIGIIIKIDRVTLGFAQIQEFRDELKYFKSKGKNVYAILTERGNKEYYLASIANKIIYNPGIIFSLSGLSAEIYFYKNALDKVGIKYESIKKGKYKSFNEPFTKEHISDEYKENIISLLSNINDQFVNDIATDRKIGRDKITELFESGIMTPEEALKSNFIDSIEYPVDAEHRILKNHGFVNSKVTIKNYLHEKKKISKWGPIPGIAIINVSGAIIRGKSKSTSPFTTEVSGDETYFKNLRNAFNDNSIKAIIIRVDSGGGSAAASDLMWHYLVRMLKKCKKPVVFSFGNIAASGGYYIACTGHNKIFGSKGSITGSIGVISGKISLKRLYEKIGITTDIIKMSDLADIFSLSKDLTPRERKVIQRGVDLMYHNFTAKVRQARKISTERISAVAEGRVFSGFQAMKNGLIDRIGGIIAAIEFAKIKANIKGIYRTKQITIKKRSLMEFYGNDADDRFPVRELKKILSNLEWLEFCDESALYYFPYQIVIK